MMCVSEEEKDGKFKMKIRKLGKLEVSEIGFGCMSISANYGPPANPGSVELTVSSYLMGFSVGQLLWGPVGDRYGRRLPITIGLVFFILGSAGCALSGSVDIMIIWRIVQAMGACAGVVLACAMVRDLYSGERAAQMMSTLMTVMGQSINCG